ncbi:hypothetical protein [Pseudobacteriovorax antillogorgiicola]|uniref:Uncharacterized protein n=1 Tax=Pseudobacteriovorax antillogorgiicola TaxID=1513793 RepID=A0A1Y6CM09_9BACT|nr:hypothetical protein [Pseudobacteriovorax antillogorgiicola]TCS47312.1 hypothetical protein EDD56_12187 [Pseudobacteriovorax antillogorgiicola]SMF62725.1 hypothetical protein SAMN06296036_12187 [Pseudobacteriovorax antillogorgiicola]
MKRLVNLSIWILLAACGTDEPTAVTDQRIEKLMSPTPGDTDESGGTGSSGNREPDAIVVVEEGSVITTNDDSNVQIEASRDRRNQDDQELTLNDQEVERDTSDWSDSQEEEELGEEFQSSPNNSPDQNMSSEKVHAESDPTGTSEDRSSEQEQESNVAENTENFEEVNPNEEQTENSDTGSSNTEQDYGSEKEPISAKNLEDYYEDLTPEQQEDLEKIEREIESRGAWDLRYVALSGLKAKVALIKFLLKGWFKGELKELIRSGNIELRVIYKDPASTRLVSEIVELSATGYGFKFKARRSGLYVFTANY